MDMPTKMGERAHPALEALYTAMDGEVRPRGPVGEGGGSGEWGGVGGAARGVAAA